jgi:hypothetical protein
MKIRVFLAYKRILYYTKLFNLEWQTILLKEVFIFFARKSHFLFSKCHKSMFLWRSYQNSIWKLDQNNLQKY